MGGGDDAEFGEGAEVEAVGREGSNLRDRKRLIHVVVLVMVVRMTVARDLVCTYRVYTVLFNEI